MRVVSISAVVVKLKAFSISSIWILVEVESLVFAFFLFQFNYINLICHMNIERINLLMNKSEAKLIRK